MLADSQGRGLIIWPIAIKLFQSVMLQTRPRYAGRTRVFLPPSLPWNMPVRSRVATFNRVNRTPMLLEIIPTNFALCALGLPSFRLTDISLINKPDTSNLKKPGVVHALKVMPKEVFEIVGVSKDSSDVVLPNCTMCLFRVDRDSGNNIIYTHLGNTISDGSGNYFFAVNKGSTYRVTGENGSVVGMTLNTLTGVLI